MLHNKTFKYRVANHCFVVTIPKSYYDSHSEFVSPYKPFELSDKECNHEVFNLELCNDLNIDISQYSLLISLNEYSNMKVYKNNLNEYYFEIYKSSENIIGRFHISSDYKNIDLELSGEYTEQSYAFNRAIMISYLLSTAQLDTIMIHSSVIYNNGKGYLFLGKSGTGKSTHSSLWLNNIPDSKLINDDNPIISYSNGKAYVYGSPWSGKTNCYKNISAPIGGFVKLSQAKENNIQLLNAIESYASLITSCSGMTWENKLAEGKFNTIKKLIEDVKCWHLNCLPNKEAAILCANNIRG